MDVKPSNRTIIMLFGFARAWINESPLCCIALICIAKSVLTCTSVDTG